MTPSFYPAHWYGGPIQSVLNLCDHLARRGCEVRVLTTNANGPHATLGIDSSAEREVRPGVGVRYCPRIGRESASPVLLRHLPSYLAWADVVHLTGVYSFPTLPALSLSRLIGRPVLWSPRGSLQRWTGTRRPVLKAAWERACRAVRPRRLALHVTSAEEAAQSSARIPGVPVRIIPNGVEVPDRVLRTPRRGSMRLLYLGRLHPIKAIDNLLAACAQARDTFSRLVVAGAGDPAYAAGLKLRAAELGLASKVIFAGEIKGDAKEAAFANADALVLPSHTENFGMAVAEALAHAVPVIAGTGTPWGRLPEQRCGLWVDNDPGSLACALALMNRMPLEDMGWNGHAWMKREFSWSACAQRTLQAYEALDGPRPGVTGALTVADSRGTEYGAR